MGMKNIYNEKTAVTYDKSRFKTIRGRIFRYFRNRILNKYYVRIEAKGETLDLACGTGLIAEWFLMHGEKVTGSDFSMPMLNMAKQKLGLNGFLKGFVNADAHFLPFSDKSFDIITCFRFLNLMSPASRLIIHKEVSRVSRSYFLASYSIDSPYQKVRRLVKKLLGYPGSGAFPVTKFMLKEELKRTGIFPIDIKTVFPLLTEEMVVLAEIKQN
jgi:ubiquinone/menaquinone biosynthesis C-methylase UbiE